MSKPDALYKTTIVIWTDYDPSGVELEDLARDATSGEALCGSQETTKITDPAEYPDTDFFGDLDGEEEDGPDKAP